MRYYPVLLDLHERYCVVIGCGDVGRRKLRSLLEASPKRVLVLDVFSPEDKLDDTELQDLLSHPAVVYESRPFAEADLQGATLAFACTGIKELNAQVASACKKLNILCNVIDDPTAGSFIVPAHFTSGELLIALATGGSSPALSRRIRMELQERVGDRYAALVALMGRVRPLVLAQNWETKTNTTLFRALVNSSLVDELEAADYTKAAETLHAILPQELHPSIGALLHELA